VVTWINEVCEMYEIDEADVSKLKTLSGAGLNHLQRQDWIERSPNQGDLFFNLWVKLIENSQDADVSETSKSPPASPRKGRRAGGFQGSEYLLLIVCKRKNLSKFTCA